MRWRALVIGSFGIAVAACQRMPTAPPQSYKHLSDQWIVRLGLPAVGVWPCDGARLDYDECYKMQPAQRWSGTWVTEFESFHFCPGASVPCAWRDQPRYELAWNRRVFTQRPQIKADVGKVYAVDFVGRRTAYRTDGWAPAYVIVVDRLISKRDLGSLNEEE